MEQGSTGDASTGEGDDLQVRRVLHEGVELPLVAYTRRNADLQGRVVDELELRRRKLAVRCGFCARGECRFGAACGRTQRAVVESDVVDQSVVSTDSVIDGSKVYEFGDDEDAATGQCGRCSDTCLMRV